MQLREQSIGVTTDLPPQIDIDGDPYVWVEPFRDMTYVEFEAKELYQERVLADKKAEFEAILNANPLGSLLQTGDGKWWRIIEVPDGFSGAVKRAIEPAKTNRAGRRGEAKVNTKKRFR